MEKYDVAIIGGGTAGCAAAYQAAKLGLKTLLVEKNIHLGGTITSGLVVPVMKSSENQINTEFFDILVKKLKELGGQITYQGNSGWFNPELVKIALDLILEEVNVDIRFSSEVTGVKITNSTIESFELNTNILSPYICAIGDDNIHADKGDKLSVSIGAKYVVDATGDNNFSKICGCKFLDNKNKIQPTNLRFILSGVDADKFGNWLENFDKNREVSTVERIGGETYFSTAYTWDDNVEWALRPLFKDAEASGMLKPTDSNYFQLFSVAGTPNSVAFNCPRIVGTEDIFEVKQLSKALIEARKAIFRLTEFCKKYLPGFENAYISNIADEIGIRSSRRIEGKYVYTQEDLVTGRKFETPVLVANYPIDVHSDKKNSSTLKQVQDYQLPIEALMSADVENLFVIGRGISADEMAQGALRVQASCFSMGVGLAKYIAKEVQK